MIIKFLLKQNENKYQKYEKNDFVLFLLIIKSTTKSNFYYSKIQMRLDTFDFLRSGVLIISRRQLIDPSVSPLWIVKRFFESRQYYNIPKSKMQVFQTNNTIKPYCIFRIDCRYCLESHVDVCFWKWNWTQIVYSWYFN
jgi:hypothetical protein